MSTDKPYVFELMVGDHSNDGHGEHDSYRISCNLDAVQLQKAYKKGTKILGFSIEKLCESANQCDVKVKHLRRMIELGLPEWEFPEEDEDDSKVEIYPESYVDLWLFTAKLGDTSLEYEQQARLLSLPIGGYGLYYC